MPRSGRVAPCDGSLEARPVANSVAMGRDDTRRHTKRASSQPDSAIFSMSRNGLLHRCQRRAMSGNSSPIGLHSSRNRLRKIDGRTSAGKYVRQIQRDLVAECGGEAGVSTAQRLLIERTAIDLLRLRLMDQALASGELSDH